MTRHHKNTRAGQGGWTPPVYLFFCLEVLWHCWRGFLQGVFKPIPCFNLFTLEVCQVIQPKWKGVDLVPLTSTMTCWGNGFLYQHAMGWRGMTHFFTHFCGENWGEHPLKQRIFVEKVLPGWWFWWFQCHQETKTEGTYISPSEI